MTKPFLVSMVAIHRIEMEIPFQFRDSCLSLSRPCQFQLVFLNCHPLPIPEKNWDYSKWAEGGQSYHQDIKDVLTCT